MSLGLSKIYSINLITISSYAIILIALVAGTCKIVHSYPAANIMFSSANKLEDKPTSNDESAEQSFQQFIGHSMPDSTLIGELKPNSSSLELRLFKDKIASAILSMQEMDRAKNTRSLEPMGADCFIESTKVERIPGKCHKVNNGLPICQSNNYMAINMDCQ